MGDSTIQTASAPVTSYVVGGYGIDYAVKGESRRAEPGDVVDDIPAGSIPWLVKSGAVEVAKSEPEPVSVDYLPSLPALSLPSITPTPASALLAPKTATA